MEYIKLINRFWETNRNTQFTMAETTLYFYLLNEANRNYWQMPIACATAIICASTGMTKATLIRARNGLKNKGLIGFTEGVQHSRAPTYHIRTFETDGETADSTANWQLKDWRSLMDKDILAIDDLGTEPREIIEYGNVLSPIIDLISYRYEHQLPTIITSNLTPQQISEVYGKRIGDRLKETTEIVPFLNGSYRG